MNLFETIICNQYHELKKRHKGDSARTNGVVLISVAVFCSIGAIFSLALFISARLGVNLGVQGAGRIIARLAVLSLGLVIYLVVNSIYGKKSKFEEITSRFDALMEDRQEAVSRKGLIIFLSSIGAFILSIFLQL